ncbi:hypothetical protein M0812_08746 [Anaeramoeba flamelloides]|uniref:Uncharacterized protein n=1 Tax=Anaeramoeba flamelloides TaxID=1746091 RepID=A0AAV7ZYD1_9EUKA|nr:hypothetical protein M0812_08746 [Anaeramoeba flamelloides]
MRSFNHKTIQQHYKKMDRISDSLAILSCSFEILHYNPKFAKLFKMKKKLKDLNLTDFLPPNQTHNQLESKVHLKNEIEKLKKNTNLNHHFEILFRTRSELEFYCTVNATRISINGIPSYQFIAKKMKNNPQTGMLQTSTSQTMTENLSESSTQYSSTLIQEQKISMDFDYENYFQETMKDVMKTFEDMKQTSTTKQIIEKLNSLLGLYENTIKHKNEKIEKLSQKSREERKKQQTKYEELETHFKRRLHALENEKKSNNSLLSNNQELKTKLRNISKILSKQKILTKDFKKNLVSTKDNDESDSDDY